jgi:hypothetical protein
VRLAAAGTRLSGFAELPNSSFENVKVSGLDRRVRALRRCRFAETEEAHPFSTYFADFEFDQSAKDPVITQ